MPAKFPTILAIDPSTKEAGVAVLSGPELQYFGVKTFRRHQPLEPLPSTGKSRSEPQEQVSPHGLTRCPRNQSLPGSPSRVSS